jgi:CDGSH-type Zn-finger protein
MSVAIVAQKGPYPVDVVAGRTYWWCACGRSARQPFCDGSHKVTNLEPVSYKAETSMRLFFCGCKQTGKRPFCDGTHGRL